VLALHSLRVPPASAQHGGGDCPRKCRGFDSPGGHYPIWSGGGGGDGL